MISVFTPSHDPKYLDECWSSLKAQTYQDFEWIVVLNGGAWWWSQPNDKRVVVFDAHVVRGVGALKHYACKQAQGDILCELDHDDLLASHALEDVVGTFEIFPEVGFVYSDCAQIREDGTADLNTFDLGHGWEYRHDVVDGREVFPFASMEPTPHNLSYIWYAPNHLRAFRRDIYESAGGYDIGLEVLDDQDLMCRLYQATEFCHLPETLYLQRVHPDNTQSHAETNALIQKRTVELYDRYIEANCLAWAKRKGLGAYDLGGAHNSPEGYTSVDFHDADICGDIFDVLGKCPDNSLGVIRASDFLEHVTDKIRLMNEIHRVLAPNGMLLSCTPSTDGRGAFQDPTHVSYWNENSFWYWTDSEYAKYVPEITARFQVSRLVTFFPSEWHKDHDIPYVQANLVKPGDRNGGYLHW